MKTIKEKLTTQLHQEEQQLISMRNRENAVDGFVTRDFADKIQNQHGIIKGIIIALNMMEVK
tara:strand:+ start:1689 stop:1874 length:186 start_codon:yes stop_codon:yes gene_type:complete